MTKNEAEIILLFEQRSNLLKQINELEKCVKTIENKIETIRLTDIDLLFPSNSIVWNL